MILNQNQENSTDWTNSSKYGVRNHNMVNNREVLQAGPVLDAFRMFMNANKFPFTFDMAVATFK